MQRQPVGQSHVIQLVPAATSTWDTYYAVRPRSHPSRAPPPPRWHEWQWWSGGDLEGVIENRMDPRSFRYMYV